LDGESGGKIIVTFNTSGLLGQILLAPGYHGATLRNTPICLQR
jgi:hypothetical protein